MQDRINVIYTDMPLTLTDDFDRISRYTENVSAAAYDALAEEAILVTTYTVYHTQASGRDS